MLVSLMVWAALAGGAMALSGVYLAMWVKTEGRWTIKSGAFVALNCSGSTACKRFVL